VKVCEALFRVAVRVAFWFTAPTVALKIVLFCPAGIVALLGTLTLALLLERVMVAPPEGAAAVRVTVQVAVPGTLTVAGEQLKLLSWVAAARLSVAGWLWPLRLAVMVTLWPLLTVPVVAANVAVLWPAWTDTLAGTATKALLLLSETAVRAAAFWFSDTVQVLEALLPRVDGTQASDVSWTGGTRLRLLVRLTPPALAVTTAPWLVLTCAAVEVKLAAVCPADTVTLPGTVRLALLLDSETGNPPTGAAAVKERAHAVLDGVLRVVLVQLSPLSATGPGREIVPEFPPAEIGAPPAVEATTLVIWTGIVVLEEFDAIWNVAIATGPLPMTLLFNPTIKQLFPTQDTDFPALAADAPGATVTVVMFEEKLKVHWRPAVCAPPESAKLIGSVTVPPGDPEPDPMDNETLCPNAIDPSKARKMKRLRTTRPTPEDIDRGTCASTVGLYLSEYQDGH
jgi:hypothetical protein